MIADPIFARSSGDFAVRLTAKLTTVFAILITVFALSAAQAAEPVGHTDIDTAELAVLLERGTKVVDIRRADEWRETGVIPGSKLLTAFDAGGLLNPQFPAEFGAFVEKDEPVIIICRSGNRSETMSRILWERAGYTQIYNASGGIVSWIDDGNPTEPCLTC